MLEDSKPASSLVRNRVLDLLPKDGGHVICLDTFDWSGEFRSRITHHVLTHPPRLRHLHLVPPANQKARVIHHRNVSTLVGIDERSSRKLPGVWAWSYQHLL